MKKVRRVWFFWLGLLALALLAAAFAPQLFRSNPPGDWRVVMCDVGQGDAVLVRSEQSIALVDTGPKPDRLGECLDKFSVSRINLLVLSHFDKDHVGGYKKLLGRVDKALIGEEDRELAGRIVAALKQGGAAVSRGYRGLSGYLGKLSWRLIWPRASSPKEFRQGNGGSLTIAFWDDSFSVLFLGDLGRSSQARLLELGLSRRYDLVKVAHHGSADQNPALYARLGAKYGLISVGSRNSYGHPTPRLLKILADNRIEALRTDKSGSAAISGNRNHYQVWTEK